MTCIVPGSFDPITLGHLDVIERASKLFDRVVVAVLRHHAKTPSFPDDARLSMIRRACAHLPGVEVILFDGLLIDCARAVHASAIIKGLRGSGDYEYEAGMASLNRRLAPEIETLMLHTDIRFADISSSAVRQIAALGGNIEALVPKALAKEISAHMLKGGRA